MQYGWGWGRTVSHVLSDRRSIPFSPPGAARFPTALLTAARFAGRRGVAVVTAGALGVATAPHSQARRLVAGKGYHVPVWSGAKIGETSEYEY